MLIFTPLIEASHFGNVPPMYSNRAVTEFCLAGVCIGLSWQCKHVLREMGRDG